MQKFCEILQYGVLYIIIYRHRNGVHALYILDIFGPIYREIKNLFKTIQVFFQKTFPFKKVFSVQNVFVSPAGPKIS